MNAPPAIQRLSAWPGYLLFSLTTLLWVAAALPAGPLTGASRVDDASTPLVRQGWSLVPTLLLLVVAPVGMTLTAKRQGQLMLLAATDAFLALYAGLALTFRQQLPSAFQSPTVAGHLLAGGLVLLGALSVVECRRIARGELDAPAHGLGGLRLALCLLVLVVPSWPLLVPGREIASLLAPYLYLAVSAAGARLARTGPGLAFTSSLLQLALAGHVLVTLRFTLAHEDPPVGMLGAAGQATLLLAWAVLAMAGLQVLVRVPRRGTHEPVTPAPAAAGRGAAA